MRRRRIATVVVGLATVVTTTLGTALPASANTRYEQRLEDAVERVTTDDGWTQADIDIILENPSVAVQVPDPRVPTVVESESSTDEAAPGDDSGGEMRAAGEQCGQWVDVWFSHSGLLGGTIYKWHHYVGFCTSGGRVTRWENRYDYLTDTDGVIQRRELTANQTNGIGTGSAWSMLQRKLEYCVVRYGCYATVYPWSRITVNGNGTHSYVGGAT